MHTQPSLLNALLTTHISPHTHLFNTGVRTLLTYTRTLFPGHQTSPLPAKAALFRAGPSPTQVQRIFFPGLDCGPSRWPLPAAE